MRTLRRRSVGLSAILAVGLAGALAPVGAAPAVADDASTLTVVGTSDVFDSFLVQKVLEPAFEEAYPQYDLKYVSRGTGAAITFAKAGTASAMIVHAAALENQFVDEGYSAEGYGRAIFYGDYVLLGPESDPAGVLDGSEHDIVGAYEKVAAAGAAGDAEFVSRGGTPGTTVQEHAIWALTDGVPTCTVSAANGGGVSPSDTAGDCGASIDYPSWYHATGLTQGPNVLAGDACNGYDSDACYVFTDRGTFNYLQSQNSITRLGIVTGQNDVEGQLDLLINSFHAYAIDPDKFADNPNVQINLPAATAFLDWLTSEDGQAAVGAYLDDAEGGAPFLPSAAPSITLDETPTLIQGGDKVKVTGTLANVVPGTPALAGQDVDLLATPISDPNATPTTVATVATGRQGRFALSYQPNQGMTYSVASGPISQVVNDTLDPVFGDRLAPTSAVAGPVFVQGTVNLDRFTASGRTIRAEGVLAPAVIGRNAKAVLWASRVGSPLEPRGDVKKLRPGQSAFKADYTLPAGTWKIQVRYANPGFLVTGASQQKRVTLR